MSDTVVIALREPIIFHDGAVRSITLREPTWSDHEALGDIDGLMRAADGAVSRMTYPAVLAAYAKRCVTPADHASILNLLPLRETLAVHEAIAGFFIEARNPLGSTAGSPAS